MGVELAGGPNMLGHGKTDRIAYNQSKEVELSADHAVLLGNLADTLRQAAHQAAVAGPPATPDRSVLARTADGDGRYSLPQIFQQRSVKRGVDGIQPEVGQRAVEMSGAGLLAPAVLATATVLVAILMTVSAADLAKLPGMAWLTGLQASVTPAQRFEARLQPSVKPEIYPEVTLPTGKPARGPNGLDLADPPRPAQAKAPMDDRKAGGPVAIGGGAATRSAGTSLAAATAAAAPTPDAPVGRAGVEPAVPAGRQREMLAHSRRLVGRGEIERARTLLARAAANGRPGAKFALAETFDPNMLAAWGQTEPVGDVDTAREFYQQAQAAGDQRAQQRIDALSGALQRQVRAEDFVSWSNHD